MNVPEFEGDELRTRHMRDGRQLYANAAGNFYLANGNERLTSKRGSPALCEDDSRRLYGFAPPESSTFWKTSERLRARARQTICSELDYLILVPTLRCDLACSYCQVSRVNLDRSGYDWTDSTLAGVLRFIDTLSSRSIKIEFQGGEPTLRLDLIKAVIARCERFEDKQFVICSNLGTVPAQLLDLLERPDVLLSTSLDGSLERHSQNRTGDVTRTSRFFDNLRMIIDRFGADKVSALPTINQQEPPAVAELIDMYESFGFRSIYLRPINYQGFARKNFAATRDGDAAWWRYFDGFVEELIQRNYHDQSRVLEESYLSLCLKRIFRTGLDRHVDLRNPNPVGVDYLVVDYDGKIYPTDEARMLTRSHVVDLAIGDLETGYDGELRRLLHSHSTNLGDPACDSCTYQAFCGRDLIDDLSRYGRIDLPRHETYFCQKHLHMFDLCMELIYSDRPEVQYSLAKWLGLAGQRLPAQAVLA